MEYEKKEMQKGPNKGMTYIGKKAKGEAIKKAKEKVNGHEFVGEKCKTCGVSRSGYKGPQD